MKTFLHQARQWTDETLLEYCKEAALPDELGLSVREYVLGKGKAVRPALLFWVYQQFVGQNSRPSAAALNAALSLEFVHSYSLVHDDLPCMDDDDFRRGFPTPHRLKGEAFAVLLGDTLLTSAFEMLSKNGSDSSVKMALVQELSHAAGLKGMLKGQLLDIKLENALKKKQRFYTKEEIDEIHDLKTGALFGAACTMGALASESFTQKDLKELRSWGVLFGRLFQVIDDLHDKSLYFQLLGEEVLRKEADKISQQLLSTAHSSWSKDSLCEWLGFMKERKE